MFYHVFKHGKANQPPPYFEPSRAPLSCVIANRDSKTLKVLETFRLSNQINVYRKDRYRMPSLTFKPPPPRQENDHAGSRRDKIRPPCDQIITLVEKVDALERWKASTENDLKEIREIISQVKLLMSLSIGGGGLSVLTLIISLILLVTGNK
jgi:hypothetical protein